MGCQTGIQSIKFMTHQHTGGKSLQLFKPEEKIKCVIENIKKKMWKERNYEELDKQGLV